MATLGMLRERSDDYRALFDPITGLPKRALLLDRLTLALARAHRAGRFVGLLSISVEFVPLRSNQAMVHALAEIALRLTSLLRGDDSAARVEDGCAFVVVCNDLIAQDELDLIAARLTSELGKPLVFDVEPVAVQITVTSHPAGVSDHDADQLLDTAARAALTR